MRGPLNSARNASEAAKKYGLRARLGWIHPAIAPASRGGRPIGVKVHDSVLHAMSRAGLGPAWRRGAEESLEAEFEIGHGHDAVDGPLAELGGQGEYLGGDLSQLAILVVQAVQLPPLWEGWTLVPPAPELLRIDIDEL